MQKDVCNVCAPVIRLPLSKLKAPALTDFSRIFVCDEVNHEEEAVLLKHEQAHIWLRHNKRTPREDPFIRSLWTRALELEIARNIYTPQDIQIIKRPFSVLSTGYLPDSIPDMPPELLLAEDIYDWLKDNEKEGENSGKGKCTTSQMLEQKQEQQQQQGESEQEQEGEGESEQEQGEGEEESGTMTKEELEEIVEKLNSLATSAITPKMRKQPPLEMPPPTLSSTIDYVLRASHTRRASYKRPSRKQDETPFILKGQKRERKSPFVEIFVDRSGSFTPEKTRLAEEKVKSVLIKYRARLEYDVLYFGNDKLTTEKISGGGNTPYHLILNHLEMSRPEVAVIITDYDSGEGLKPLAHKLTKIVCIPIGTTHTAIAPLIGAIDVQ